MTARMLAIGMMVALGLIAPQSLWHAGATGAVITTIAGACDKHASLPCVPADAGDADADRVRPPHAAGARDALDTIEMRDGLVMSGMVRTSNEGFDRLEKLLAALR